MRSRKKNSKIEFFSVQWTVDFNQLYKAIKNILLNIYSLQYSLTYRSWSHKNKILLSIDNFLTRSSIKSQTSKETLQKVSSISFFYSLMISISSSQTSHLFISIESCDNFTLNWEYNSREEKHKLFEQIFFELIKNFKKYKKITIYKRWMNNENQLSSRKSSLVLTFNWSHLDSDSVSRFDRFALKGLQTTKALIEILNSSTPSKASKSLRELTQKELSSIKHEISRDILSKTYFNVSISSNHLIKFDIFDQIQIFLFRDHLVRLKQTYTQNNNQSISKNQSVEINLEKVKSIENLATANLEKKVARNSSSLAFFKKVKISKSVKFFIQHILNLSQELRFSLIEFIDNLSSFVASAWIEISFWAFDKSIKNVSIFGENLITVVERFVILTNSSDSNPLSRNQIVELVTAPFSNNITSHQNPTIEDEKENIESMSLIENLSELSEDSEISEKSQLVSKLTLSQTDIQSIVMSMFQLFIQNIQTNSSIAMQFISQNQFRAFDIEFFD